MGMMRLIFAGVVLLARQLPAQFEYDRKQAFDTTCEALHPRPDAEIRGCGFTGPRGARVNFIQVSPRGGKPPYAGVTFQHGGGQSMTNYCPRLSFSPGLACSPLAWMFPPEAKERIRR
jgi:hypothetical protein